MIGGHHLYISSRHRAAHEAPCRMVLELPDGAILQDDPAAQNLRVALAAFSFECSWYEIGPQNCAFSLDNQQVALEPGNYPFDQLARAISRAQTVAACRYDFPSGKLVFSAAQAFTLTFADESWEALGFARGFPAASEAVSEGAHLLRSDVPLRGRRAQDLFMRLNNVSVETAFRNFSNHGNAQLAPSSILCPIPVTADPFAHQHTDLATMGALCAVTVTDDRLAQLEIDIVDERGELATWIGDWTAVLDVQVLDARRAGAEELDVLRQMRALLDQMLTLKVVGARRA